MKQSAGCVGFLIAILIICFVSSIITNAIADWIQPNVSKQTFAWIHNYLPLIITISIGGIFDFVIMPFFKKYLF